MQTHDTSYLKGRVQPCLALLLFALFSFLSSVVNGADNGGEITGPDGLPLIGEASIDTPSGSNSFSVPITYWMDQGSPVIFAIFYSSRQPTDPENANDPREFENFARLSERNSKWRHSFSQWIDHIRLRDDGNKKCAALHTEEGNIQFLINFRGHDDFEKDGASYTAIHSNTSVRLSSSGLVKHDSPCGDDKKGWTAQAPAYYVAQDEDGTRSVFDQLVWRERDCQAVPHYLLSRIESKDGRALTIHWSLGPRPRVISVKDKSHRGLDFTYTNDLLTSAKDSAGRIHLFSYTAVPDENKVNRKKLTGIKIMASRSPQPVYRKWGFAYRDATRPAFNYGGTYTGDLVIRKSDPLGKTSDYEYEPVNIADRAKLGKAWQGRIVRGSWREKQNGVWVRKTIRRQVVSDREIRIYYPDGHVNVTLFDEKGNLVDNHNEILSEPPNAEN
jgi:hypothetical protein